MGIDQPAMTGTRVAEKAMTRAEVVETAIYDWDKEYLKQL
jgi:hypothetical protein